MSALNLGLRIYRDIKAGGLPAYDFAASFKDRPGLVPGLLYSSGSVRAMIPQFDGTLVQPLVNEIPNWGGRRVWNMRPNDLTVDVGFDTQTTAIGQMLNMTGAGQSYYYLRNKGNANLSSGTLVFARALISCAAGTRTVGLRLANTAGGNSAQQSITVGVVPTEHWLALTLTAVGAVGFGLELRGSLNGGADTSPGLFVFDELQMTIGRAGQTIPDPEYVSNGAIADHGNGLPDTRWFDTDEYGNDLTVGLGQELWGLDTTADIGNFDGSTGAHSGTSFSNLTIGTNAGYPRFTFRDMAIQSKTNYRCFFKFSEGNITLVRLATAGSGEVLSGAAGFTEFSGDVVAAAVEAVEFLGNGQLLWSQELLSGTVREIYPVKCVGTPRLPAITNLFSYSEDFSNSAWAKTGISVEAGNPQKIVATGTSAHTLYQDNTVVSGQEYTMFVDASAGEARYLQITESTGFSITGYQNYDLLTGSLEGSAGSPTVSIESLGKGIYRCFYTRTANANGTGRFVFSSAETSTSGRTESYTANDSDGFFVYRTQFEAATTSFAYVKTTTAAVTTTAEGASLDLSLMGYDQDGGTWLTEFTPFLPSSAWTSNQVVLNAIQDADSNNRYILYNANGDMGVFARDDSVIQANVSQTPEWVTNEATLAAIQFEADHVRMFRDGVLSITDNTATVPGVNNIDLGTVFFAGAFGAIYYYGPTVVTDADGIAMTTAPRPNIPQLAAPVPPVYAADFSSSTATWTPDENQAIAGTAVATGTPSIVYSITGGTDASSFTINPSTGVLTANTAFDYETKTSYLVHITATNTQGSDAQTVTINVVDLADTPPVLLTVGTMGTVTGVGDTATITQPTFSNSPTILHEIIDLENNVLYTGTAINSWPVAAGALGKAIRNKWTATNAAGSVIYTSNSRGIPLGVEEWKAPNFDATNGLILSAAWVISGGKINGQVGVTGNCNNGASATGRVLRYTGVVDSITTGSILVAWDGTGGGGNQEQLTSAGAFSFDKTNNTGGNYLWNNNSDAVLDSYSSRELVSAPADANAPGTSSELSISITAASVTEQDTGTTVFTFTGTRTGNLTGAASATWTASGGAGTYPANATDFVGGSFPTGTVSFADGVSTASILVNVQGDTTEENNETFVVTLTDPVNSALSVTEFSEAATILDDDTAASSDRTALLAKVDEKVALRGGGWLSDVNGSPCSNPSNSSLVTSTDAYTRFPAFDGLRHAYISTTDQSYVTHMMAMCNEYIDDGTDTNSDGWDSWYNCGTAGYDHDHYEWRAASGIGQTLCLLIDYPALALSTSANKLKLGNFLRDHVWDKWQPGNFGTGNTNTNCSYFSSRLMMVVVALDKYFGGTTYSNWISSQGTLITNMLEANIDGGTGAANIWGRTNSTDVGGSPTPGTVDMGHATEVGIAAQIGLDYGYSFVDQANLDSLAKALTRKMWNGTGFRENVNGTGSVDNTIAKNIQGWIYLVKHDSSYLAAFRAWVLNGSTFPGSSVSHEARLATYAAILRLTP